MVLPKERRFGVKRELICDDSGDTDGAGLAVSDEVALVWLEHPPNTPCTMQNKCFCMCIDLQEHGAYDALHLSIDKPSRL